MNKKTAKKRRLQEEKKQRKNEPIHSPTLEEREAFFKGE
jgi:hypothetical protein